MAKFDGEDITTDELLEALRLMEQSITKAFVKTANINLNLRIDLGKAEKQIQELKDTIAYYENELKVTRRP